MRLLYGRISALAVALPLVLAVTGLASPFVSAQAPPDITISANTTWAAGAYTYGNVRVTNNAKLTLQSNTALPGFQGVQINAVNLTVDAGASISADSLGWPSDLGPGAGLSDSGCCGMGGSGASHAGEGGDGAWSFNRAGSTVIYGNASGPVDLGSGGGTGWTAVGGPGGGAIRVNLSGTATINGVVSANGGAGSSSSQGVSGGGSGGSVWLTASQLAGSGTVRANGGDGGTWTSSIHGGGGSGGRVAVEYASATFTGNTLVHGGTGGEDGEEGTVVFNGALSGLADSGNPWTTMYVTTKHYPANGMTYNANRLVIQAGGSIELKPKRSNGISAVELVVETGGAVNLASGDYTTNTAVTLNGITSSSPKNVQGGIWTAVTLSGGAITIPDGGVVKATRVSVQANSLVVGTTGTLSADGLGWPSDSGPGAGLAYYDCCGMGGSGASHAGEGGDGDWSFNRFGSTVIYGNASAPVDLGSGGGTGWAAVGGPGGGAIRVNISGTATISGVVSANGGAGASSANGVSGGGSGGSVWLTASQLAGSGTVRANGGDGGTWTSSIHGGGGSGGRVAVEYASAPFTGNTLVVGGNGSVSNGDGEDGTVMFNGALSGLADSGNPWTMAYVTTHHYLASGLTYDFSHLVIQAGGSLELKTGRSNGINADGFTIDTGGTVSMGAKSDLTIMADTTIASGLISLASGDSTTSTALSLSSAASTLKNIQGATWSAVNLSGGVITIPDGGVVKATRVSVQANSLVVGTTGTLSADGLGWPSDSGPGVGLAYDDCCGMGGSGASHAGEGGDGAWSFNRVGSTVIYGNADGPVDLGSGGGTGWIAVGGPGGGAIRVNISGTATISGVVSANGGAGASSANGVSGGGSGGSVWLTASQLAGSGTVRANGGCGGTWTSSIHGGGGSGGRVAVENGVNSFAGTVQATNSSCNGQNGTSTTPTLRAMPVITWSNPVAIIYGVALGETQLNAVTSIPGGFSYAPAAGTVLSAGGAQNLHVDFTPTDIVNYSSGFRDVKVNILKATPAFSGLASATIAYSDTPTALGGTIKYGMLVPTGSVSITISSLTQSAAINPVTGSFSLGFPTGTLGVGSYAITYQYSGDMNFNGAADSSKTITVTGGTTAFSGLSSPTAPYMTSSTSLAGTIKNGTLIPTGSVVITVNGIAQWAAINQATGAFSSSFATGNMWVSSYLINYFYAGDANSNGLTDNTRRLTVSKATPAFSGLSSPIIALGSTPTSMAGTIKNGSRVPSGDVSITVNGVTQSAPIDPATGSFSSSFATSALGEGSYAIAYQYGGDANFNGVTDTSMSVAVNSPTPSFSNLSSPTTIYGDTSTTLGGTIRSGSVPTGSVSISLNGVTQGAPIDPATGDFSSSFATGTLGAGSRTITYQYGGDANFNGVTDSSKTLTVNKTALTVTANSASRAYGDANPAFTASYSGFKNGETLGTSGVTGSPSLTTTATPASPVSGGPYPIAAAAGTLVAGNYSFTFINGSLTVNKATPSLTWENPADINYPTALSNTQLNAAAPVTGSLTYTPANGTVLSAGTNQDMHVDFTPTDTANYNTASKNVKITVLKATPSFSNLASAAITYGDSPVSLSGTIGYGSLVPSWSVSIILNGVTQAASIDPATGNFSSSFSTGALGAGSHGITYQYGGDANFNGVTDSSKAIMVDKATLTVTADNVSRTLGDPNPAFTASYSGFKNGESLATSGVTGSPSFTTTATPTSPVSGNPYTITAALGTLAGSNYTFTFVNGTLTVRDAILTPAVDPPANADGWNGTDATVSLTAADGVPGPGVKEIHYNLNGGPEAVISGSTVSVLLTTEGFTTVNYYAVDNAGNADRTRSLTVNIDKTSPSTTVNVSQLPNADGWNNTDVTIALAAGVDLSGVREISYRLDGGHTTVFPGGSGSLMLTTDGVHTVTYSAKDAAGNTESEHSLTVRIDKTPPEAFNQFDPITRDMLVYGTDSLSGVAPGSVALAGPVTPIAWGDGGAGGTAELRTYRVVDLAGNTLVVVEKVRKVRSDIRATVWSLQYNDGPVVVVPKNEKSARWALSGDGSLKELTQSMEVGLGPGKQRADAIFLAVRDETTMRVKRTPTAIVTPGLRLLRMVSRNGDLVVDYERP